MSIILGDIGIEISKDLKERFVDAAVHLHAVIEEIQEQIEARLNAFANVVYDANGDFSISAYEAAEPLLLEQISVLVTQMTRNLARSVDLYMQIMYSQVRAIMLSTLSSIYPLDVFIAREFDIPDLDSSEVEVPVQEAITSRVINTGGGVEREYQRYVRRTFRLRFLPSEVTEGLGKQLSRGLGTRAVWASKKAQGEGYIKEGLKRELTKVGKDFKDFERRLDLVLRDGMHRATTDSLSVFAANNPMVEALIRIADGKPCLVCQILHGTAYPPGSSMRDHPFGMCTWTFKLLTPEEAGIPDPTGRLAESAARLDTPPVDMLKKKFWDVDDAHKEAMFPSQQVFALWQRKHFPLNEMIEYKSNWGGYGFRKTADILRQQGGM